MSRFGKVKISILLIWLMPVLGIGLKCYTCGFDDNKDFCNPDFVWKEANCDTTAVLAKDEVLVCAKTTFVDKRAGNIPHTDIKTGSKFHILSICKISIFARITFSKSHF